MVYLVLICVQLCMIEIGKLNWKFLIWIFLFDMFELNHMIFCEPTQLLHLFQVNSWYLISCMIYLTTQFVAHMLSDDFLLLCLNNRYADMCCWLHTSIVTGRPVVLRADTS